MDLQANLGNWPLHMMSLIIINNPATISEDNDDADAVSKLPWEGRSLGVDDDDVIGSGGRKVQDLCLKHPLCLSNILFPQAGVWLVRSMWILSLV